ncbi:YolD-like family protein [Niallia sp. 03133]|uniref:YolD-like family protein n=1 Tax=Niallia sp. 03133 TaxID=3458060 RepID=UPI00404466D5
MIRDRGTKKWTAMMLPEHVAAVKEALANEKKIKKPILDESQIQEMEILLLEGMEYNLILQYDIYKNGAIKNIFGRTVYIDYIKNELRIQDKNDNIHYVPFRTLVNIQKD